MLEMLLNAYFSSVDSKIAINERKTETFSDGFHTDIEELTPSEKKKKIRCSL
jgi:hypothetical protein